MGFAFRFVLIAAGLFGIYAFPYTAMGVSDGWFQRYLAGYARLVGWILSLFEPDVVVRGNSIIGQASLQIVKSCDAMEAKLLLTAAILASPGGIARKLLAVGAGLFALTVINVLRIVTLYYVVTTSRRWFDFVHLELWPLLMIAAASGLFLLAIRFLQPVSLQPSTPGHAEVAG